MVNLFGEYPMGSDFGVIGDDPAYISAPDGMVVMRSSGFAFLSLSES